MILIILYVIHVLFDLGELAQVVCIDTCLIDGFDTQQTDAQHVLRIE